MAKVIRTLREKRARLREIEREASRLRAELRMIREAVGQAAAPQRSPRRARRRRRVEPGPTSPLGLAVAALRARGRPLRINRLLEAIERRSGRRLKRKSIESQLSRYVQRGQLVRRTGPAEFALMEGRPSGQPRRGRR